MNLLIGTDPEFFLKTSKGEFVSAHDKLPGNKKEPYRVPHGAVQVDGLACEFNIDPAATAEEFEHNIHAVMGELRKMIDPQLKFNFEPFVNIPKNYFDKLPDPCKELGCDPDFNCYSKRPNHIPKNIPARTGSGHLHFGWTKGADIKDRAHLDDCELVVEVMDGLTSYIRNAWDTDNQRQTMYGQVGSYRPKSYGVEYRVLSNAWLKYPNMWKWLFEVSRKTLEGIEENRWNGAYPCPYYSTIHYPPKSSWAVDKISSQLNLWKLPTPPKNMFEKPLEL